MKLADKSIFIAAPAPTVWHAFFDVRRWPDWNSSVSRVELLETPKTNAIGRVFPTAGRPFQFQITQITPEFCLQWEHSFAWGTKLIHSLSITANAEGAILTIGVSCEGRLEDTVALVKRRTLTRELESQALGIKAWAEEQVAQQKAPSTGIEMVKKNAKQGPR